MKTKTIRHVVIFRATPHNIYEMLMDSRMHTNFTQHKANISRKVGGRFTAFGKFIEGKNLEIGELHYSIVSSQFCTTMRLGAASSGRTTTKVSSGPTAKRGVSNLVVGAMSTEKSFCGEPSRTAGSPVTSISIMSRPER